VTSHGAFWRRRARLVNKGVKGKGVYVGEVLYERDFVMEN
jgi:hypothetical protein